MQELYDIKENLMKELKKYKDKEITVQQLEVLDALVHTIKNLDKIIEVCENNASYGNYDNSYGRRMNMNYAMNYGYEPDMYGARGRGSNAARDGMGRYAAGSGDMMSELNSLAMSMPEDHRQAIQSIMNKYR